MLSKHKTNSNYVGTRLLCYRTFSVYYNKSEGRFHFLEIIFAYNKIFFLNQREVSSVAKFPK